jgi:hypothetical protein
MAEPNYFAQFVPSAPSGGGTFVAGPGAAEAEQRKADEAQRQRDADLRAAAAAEREAIKFAQEQEQGPGGKATESQQKTLTLLTRIAGGAKDIQNTLAVDPEAQKAGIFETLSRDVLGEGAITRRIAGPERRIVTDAQANMLDAILTMGTGAAYNEEQKIANRISYFPQYGDSPREIAIKNQRLNQAIESARIAAGPLADKFDESIKPLFGTAAPATAVISEAGAAPGRLAPATAGAAQLTDEDRAAQSAMQAAYNAGISAGKTPDQIIQEVTEAGQRYGRQIDPSFLDFVRKAAEQRGPMQFIPTPTGETGAAQGLLGELLKTEPGQMAAGYFGGAANAITGGYGIDPETKDYLRKTASGSTFLGELTGGGLMSIPAIRGAQGILAGTRLAAAAPLIGETAYGALYGSGEAGEGNRLQGAAIGGLGALGAGALANRFLPGGPGTFTGAPRTNVPPAGRFAGQQISPEQIVAAGRQADIPVMTSDVRPPTTRVGKLTQSVGEVMPLGTAGTRREQQVARENAVENLLADYGVSVDSDLASEVVSNLNQTRADTISRYTDMKQNVIQQFAGRGSLPGGNVPATKSTAAIDGLLSDLRAENLPQQLGPLARQLEDIRNSLTTPGDLSKIEANRKTLFELKADPNLASISSKSEKAFQKVYTALNEDMGDYIKANGTAKDFNLWKVANTKLARTADELRVGGLKNVLNKGEFDPTLVTKMLTGSKPADVRTLFTSLSKDGRESARLLLIQDAAKRAMNKETGDVDPNKFAREVMGLSDNFSQFFGASDMRRVKGLAEVLRATSRAQTSPILARTGEQLVPFAAASTFGGLGTLLGLSFPQGVALSAAFGASKQLYESKPARDLLLRISQASGSKKAELINQFVAGAAATGGAMAGTQMSEGE